MNTEPIIKDVMLVVVSIWAMGATALAAVHMWHADSLRRLLERWLEEDKRKRDA